MHNLCIPLTALGHLICFQFLTMTNRAVMIVHVQVSVWTCVFMPLDWGAWTRIAESYGESVFKVVRMAQEFLVIVMPFCVSSSNTESARCSVSWPLLLFYLMLDAWVSRYRHLMVVLTFSSWWLVLLSLFQYVIDRSPLFFCEVSVQIFCLLK